jgi:hypothetical protein
VAAPGSLEDVAPEAEGVLLAAIRKLLGAKP